MSENREPFAGRFHGIWNVEGEGDPVAMVCRERLAPLEFVRRRVSRGEDDDVLTQFHHVFPCDIVGAWWNSYDPDPRAGSPLTIDEVIRAWNGVTS